MDNEEKEVEVIIIDDTSAGVDYKPFDNPDKDKE